MTIPFPPALSPEAQRLRDLEVFTREYSRASAPAFGLGVLPAGLLVLAAAGLLHLGWTLTAAALALSLPAVGLAGGALIRGRYQRLGLVVPDEQETVSRGWSIAIVVISMANVVGPLWFDVRNGGPARFFALHALAAVAALATVALQRRASPRHGWVQASPLFLFLAMADVSFRGVLRGEEFETLLWTWGLVLLGLGLTTFGAWAHLRHRWLERKLAGLGAPLAGAAEERRP